MPDAPYPPPLGRPRPSWVPLVDAGEGSGAEAPEGSGFPGEGWPDIGSIDYVNKLIVLIVLLLALPWLIGKLVSEPGKASRHAAGFAMGSSALAGS